MADPDDIQSEQLITDSYTRRSSISGDFSSLGDFPSVYLDASTFKSDLIIPPSEITDGDLASLNSNTLSSTLISINSGSESAPFSKMSAPRQRSCIARFYDFITCRNCC